jgi:hypothetical protein
VRPSFCRAFLLIVAGTLVGVAAGMGCAWQDEHATRDDDARRLRIEPGVAQKKAGRPWLHVEGVPPTRLHYCLFFGAWGGVIGVLLAAGGNWSVAVPVGVFGGLLGLVVERAADDLRAARGFLPASDPDLGLILCVTFLLATAAAHFSSVGAQNAKKQLRAPD